MQLLWPELARFDMTGFKLTISNLVSNAEKYTPEGRVRVTLDPGTEFATVAVHDTGMGIPAEDIPKLFTPFHRASNARRSSVFGTGVGLAGVRDIVERFGGAIELESELNVGSVFRVKIPVAEA